METKYIFLDVDGKLINEENIRLVIKKSKRMFFYFTSPSQASIPPSTLVT